MYVPPQTAQCTSLYGVSVENANTGPMHNISDAATVDSDSFVLPSRASVIKTSPPEVRDFQTRPSKPERPKYPSPTVQDPLNHWQVPLGHDEPEMAKRLISAIKDAKLIVNFMLCGKVNKSKPVSGIRQRVDGALTQLSTGGGVQKINISEYELKDLDDGPLRRALTALFTKLKTKNLQPRRSFRRISKKPRRRSVSLRRAILERSLASRKQHGSDNLPNSRDSESSSPSPSSSRSTFVCPTSRLTIKPSKTHHPDMTVYSNDQHKRQSEIVQPLKQFHATFDHRIEQIIHCFDAFSRRIEAKLDTLAGGVNTRRECSGDALKDSTTGSMVNLQAEATNLYEDVLRWQERTYQMPAQYQVPWPAPAQVPRIIPQPVFQQPVSPAPPYATQYWHRSRYQGSAQIPRVAGPGPQPVFQHPGPPPLPGIPQYCQWHPGHRCQVPAQNLQVNPGPWQPVVQPGPPPPLGDIQAQYWHHYYSGNHEKWNTPPFA
ncbi:hypothetical protein K474DRAFT_1705692 [Panus rudis PR-1116 ss-1]|nr:hypothetical protein K474DRAFT_1705692 [Panus rudis PR-1116 ss-1]